MADITQLQKQFIEYTTSLYNEGYLDNQFKNLQKMQVQDESDPKFVARAVCVFLEDAEKLLKIWATIFQRKTLDYGQVVVDVHRFKGGSSIIGAQRIKSVCALFLNYCKEKNIDGCLWCLHQANHEYILLKKKFEALFMLEQQILQAGGSIPIIE